MTLDIFSAKSGLIVVIIPPSPPTAIFLDGKKEKQAISPIAPAFTPLSIAPWAWAASSTRAILCLSHISFNLGEKV